jgi:hypothetical protein
LLHSGEVPTSAEHLPTHVRTPEGEDLAVFGQELATEVGRRHGSPVEMMHLNRGIFDEASISLITSATVGEIGRLAAQPADVRRFRPNILIASGPGGPFEEDDWVGGVLSFGDTNEAVTIAITNRDERCSMVNFDPDSARTDASVLKAIVKNRDNKAGSMAPSLDAGASRWGSLYSSSRRRRDDRERLGSIVGTQPGGHAMRLHRATVVALLIAPALSGLAGPTLVTAQGISGPTKTASRSRT